MDPCYALIADCVAEEAWTSFSRKLPLGFKKFPPEWALSNEIRERLTLLLQWHYFNPDLVADPAQKRTRAWGFANSFLDPEFSRKFVFLRGRLEPDAKTRWDQAFADFETLLQLSAMPRDLQLDWLSRLDGQIRYGASRRARVIKNKGLGFQSELLGVHPMMEWAEIRARFRYLLKRHHPDVGGDPEMTKQLIEEFTRLEAQRSQKNVPSSS